MQIDSQIQWQIITGVTSFLSMGFCGLATWIFRSLASDVKDLKLQVQNTQLQLANLDGGKTAREELQNQRWFGLQTAIADQKTAHQVAVEDQKRSQVLMQKDIQALIHSQMGKVAVS